jgi:transposase-like protein
VKINGTTYYLWRAVDQHGDVLDILVQSRRNAVAAKRFFRRETVIQPHRVPDDLDRIPVALVPRRNRHNDQSSQHHTRSTT